MTEPITTEPITDPDGQHDGPTDQHDKTDGQHDGANGQHDSVPTEPGEN